MSEVTCTFCRCVVPNVTRNSERPSHDSILKIVETWQQFWMNQTLDPEDTKRYRERACGIDANMRHDLAEKIMEVLK